MGFLNRSYSNKGGWAHACAFLALFSLVACGPPHLSLVRSEQQKPISGSPPALGPLSLVCDAARAQLLWQYDLAKQCTSDIQCNYIDGFFFIVGREDRTHPIMTSIDCGVTPMLLTANPERLLSTLQELRRLVDIQAHACTRPPDEFDADYPCDRTTSVVPAVLPVCRDRRCQML